MAGKRRRSESSGSVKRVKTEVIAFKPRIRKSGKVNKFKTVGAGSPEPKFLDGNATGTAINASGALFAINVTGQGTTAYGSTARIGQKINMKSVCVRGIAANTTANLSASTGLNNGTDGVRVAIVYDKQPNGSLPQYSDIYNTASGSYSAFAQRNVSTLDRFDVIKEDWIVLCSGGPNAGMFNMYVKLDLETRYNTGNTATISDVISGALYVVFCDQNINSNLPTNVQYTTRVKFYDD